MVGILGGALDFDGSNDNVIIPDNLNLNFGNSTSMAIEVRLNAAIFTSDPNNPFIISKGSTASHHGNYSFIVRTLGNTPLFSYTDSVSGTKLPTYFGSIALPTAAWDHVMMTYTFGNAGSMK
jgi:hypothetical protein